MRVTIANSHQIDLPLNHSLIVNIAYDCVSSLPILKTVDKDLGPSYFENCPALLQVIEIESRPAF